MALHGLKKHKRCHKGPYRIYSKYLTSPSKQKFMIPPAFVHCSGGDFPTPPGKSERAWQVHIIIDMLISPLRSMCPSLSLTKTQNPVLCALTPFSVTWLVVSVEYEMKQFYDKKFAQRGSYKKYFRAWQHNPEFIASVRASVIYPVKMSLCRTANPQQFAHCKSLYMRVSKMYFLCVFLYCGSHGIHASLFH